MDVRERRLTILGVLEQVRTACEFVSEVAQSAGMNEDAIYHCNLSVEEVCTNIVEHGYHYNGHNKSIEIVCHIYPDKLVIILIDEAPLFNPLHLNEPDPNTPLWEREGGGWGIYFVRQYMNKVEYRQENNRNHLILEKRFD